MIRDTERGSVSRSSIKIERHSDLRTIWLQTKLLRVTDPHSGKINFK